MDSSLKKLVNTYDIHEAFMNYLKQRIEIVQRSLEQATRIEDVYRLQGQIVALRRLSSLREEVNGAK